MKSVIIIFSFFLIFTACTNQKEPEEKADQVRENVITLTDAQLKNGKIETGEIQQKQISSVLKVQGRIDVPPQNLLSVSVPLGGYLKSSKLILGAQVRKNEVIAVVEDNQYIQLQQDYLTAKAQFAFLSNEYDRQRELNKSKASSDKVFEQARSTYFTQKILIKALEEKLKLIRINPYRLNENSISKSINIYSPIDGFVSKVNVNIGKYITPGDVLFELLKPANLHLNLKIFEKDLNDLSIGQQVVSYTNTNPERKYTGKIILIGRGVAADGSTEVHCHFDKPDQSLFPGMYMNAEIELKKRLSSALPDEAIVRFAGKEYVFQNIGKNTFEMTEVRPGESVNSFTEILSTSNLTGKKIVTKGAYTLLMSLKNKEEE